MGITVDAPFPHRDELGESPYWDATAGELVRVDSDRGVVHRLDPTTGVQLTIPVGGSPGFVVPATGGAMVVGTAGRLRTLDETGAGRVLDELDPAADPHRLNDGKCDSWGRILAGTLDPTFAPGGGFYRLGAGDRVTRLFGDVAVSNGLCWDDERGRFYYIDSMTQRIDVFDYDLDTGEPSDRRPFVEIPAEIGPPDGMEIDAEGGVWIVLFRGAAVHRYDSDGRLSEVVTTPTSCPTSITFGGPDLRTGYLTSSRSWLTDEQRRCEPFGGAVMTFDAGVAGRPTGVFSL